MRALYLIIGGMLVVLPPSFGDLAMAGTDPCAGITGFAAYACDIDARIAEGLCAGITFPSGSPALSVSLEDSIARKFKAAGKRFFRADDADPKKRVRLLVAAFLRLSGAARILNRNFYKIYNPCYDKLGSYIAEANYAIDLAVCYNDDGPHGPKWYCR